MCCRVLPTRLPRQFTIQNRLANAASQPERDDFRLANLWQYLFATRGLIQPVNLNQRHTGGAIHAAHNHRIVARR